MLEYARKAIASGLKGLAPSHAASVLISDLKAGTARWTRIERQQRAGVADAVDWLRAQVKTSMFRTLLKIYSFYLPGHPIH